MIEIDSKREGFEEGLSEGAHQAKVETARIFKEMGLTIEQIVKGTGLSEEEILDL